MNKKFKFTQILVLATISISNFYKNKLDFWKKYDEIILLLKSVIFPSDFAPKNTDTQSYLVIAAKIGILTNQ